MLPAGDNYVLDGENVMSGNAIIKVRTTKWYDNKIK